MDIAKDKSLEYIFSQWSGFNRSTFDRVIKSKEPLVSIVMVSWKREDILIKTLRHIFDKTSMPINLSLIVQECMNNDIRSKIIKVTEGFEKSVVKFNQHNEGISKPKDDATKRALMFNTPYIHYRDNDATLPIYATELLVSFLEDNPEYGAVNIRTMPNSSIYKFNEDKILVSKPTNKIFNPCDVVGAHCLLMRTEAIKDCNHDHNYFAGKEDMDFCVQMYHKGWKSATINIHDWYGVNFKEISSTGWRSVYNTKMKKSIRYFDEKWYGSYDRKIKRKYGL